MCKRGWAGWAGWAAVSSPDSSVRIRGTRIHTYKMSSANVTFDAKKILKSVDALQASNLKRAGRSAMKKLGFVLARKYLPEKMKDQSTGFTSAVPYTLRSVFYSAQDLRVTLSFNPAESKGNAPAKYLFPVVGARFAASKEVYPTRFSRAIWKEGIAPPSFFPVPLSSRTPAPSRRGSYYRNVLSGLKGDKSWKTVRYYSKTEVRRSSGNKSLGTGPKIYKGESGNDFGIYRVKGSSRPEMLFKYVQSLPMVPQKFDFYGLSASEAAKRIGPLISLELQKYGTTWGQRRFFEAKYPLPK